MVNEGRGLRVSHLVGVALVVGALSWMGWSVYLSRGNLLPPSTWISSIILVVTAALVFAAGLPVRRFLQGRATRTLSPLRAARTLVLAQAAALTGAGVLGFYTAQVVLLVPDIDLLSYRTLFWRLLALCASALLLSAAGMATQRMCRIEPSDEDREGWDEDNGRQDEHRH